METIKCSKCGTVMSAMSEGCPVCGTPTANHSTPSSIHQDTVIPSEANEDVKELHGLREIIEDALSRSQRLAAEDYTTFFICTYNDNSFGGGHEDCWSLGCQGGEIFFEFNGLSTEEKAMIAKLGGDELTGDTFGTDVEKVVKLFSTFIRKVWHFDGEEEFGITTV